MFKFKEFLDWGSIYLYAVAIQVIFSDLWLNLDAFYIVSITASLLLMLFLADSMLCSEQKMMLEQASRKFWIAFVVTLNVFLGYKLLSLRPEYIITTSGLAFLAMLFLCDPWLVRTQSRAILNLNNVRVLVVLAFFLSLFFAEQISIFSATLAILLLMYTEMKLSIRTIHFISAVMSIILVYVYLTTQDIKVSTMCIKDFYWLLVTISVLQAIDYINCYIK